MKTLPIPHGSELDRRIRKRLSMFWDMARKGARPDIEAAWEEDEKRVLVGRRLRKQPDCEDAGGGNGYSTYELVVPYSYALVMTAFTYLATTFLSRAPIHQYRGRHAETEDNSQALEALVNYQVQNGGLLPEYYRWFFDTCRYGVGIFNTWWETTRTARSLVSDYELTKRGISIAYESKVIPGYSGARGRVVRPYDFFWDMRVPISRVHDGEFVAFRKYLSPTKILEREAAGFYVNTRQLLKKARAERNMGGGYVDIGGSSTEQTGKGSIRSALDDAIELEATMQEEKGRVPGILVVEMQVKLSKKLWGLGDGHLPEVWVFTWAPDYDVLLGAMPLGDSTGMFQVDVMPMDFEGHGSMLNSLPRLSGPLEDEMTWLINSHMTYVRQAINGRFVVDPSRIVVKDLQLSSTGSVVRLKPQGYGQNVKEMVQPLSMPQVTQGHLAELSNLLGIGERVFGINEQMFGVLTGGGRKTATEIRTSTGFGTNRLKVVAEYLSATGFMPHSARLAALSKEYYDGQMKLRIAGDLAQKAGMDFIDVTPEMIDGVFDPVPVDGTMPVDRQAMAQLWVMILQQMVKIPPVAVQYDFPGIFEHVASLAGIRDMSKFRKSEPDPMMMQMMAQGGGLEKKGPGRPPKVSVVADEQFDKLKQAGDIV